MSNFDKLVAAWVSSTDSRPRKEREEILSNINKNIDMYRQLENPSEAYAKKQAELKRIAAENAKKEQMRAMEEALHKKEQEARRAQLPPLPPCTLASQGNHAAAGAGKSDTNKATKSKQGSHPLSTSKKGIKTPKPEDPPAQVTEMDKARLSANKLTVRDVDYKFEENVCLALQKLRAGDDGPLLEVQQPSISPPPPQQQQQQQQQKQKHRLPDARKATLPSGSILPKAGETKKAPKPRAEKPLKGDPAALCASENAIQEPISPLTPSTKQATYREMPPSLAMIEQDNDDAEQFRKDEQRERNAMELFVFGSKGTHSECDSDDLHDSGHDGNGILRFADVRADERGQDDVPIPDDVDAMRRAQQQKRPSRMGISDGSMDLDEARIANFPPTPKSRDKVKIITRVLERHYLFSFLDDSDIAKFASIMDLERFSEGEEIIVKDEVNDTLFLILNGEADATVLGERADEEVMTLGKGATFGDIGLMYESRSTMTVRAKTDLQCASLERKTYKMVTSRSMSERRERYTKYVESIPFFSGLPESEVAHLAETLKAATYRQGQKVIALGTDTDWMHFVLEGTLAVVGRDGQQVASIEQGGVAGHLEFLFSHVAVADVVASSPEVKTVMLSQRQFSRQIPHETRASMIKEAEEAESYQYYRDIKKEHILAKNTVSAFDQPPSYVNDAIYAGADAKSHGE